MMLAHYLDTKRVEARRGRNWTNVALLILIGAVVVALGCGSPKTQVRTMIPEDALIYLEAKDLARAVGPIVNHTKLEKIVKTVPDTNLLSGMEMAIAVTGFETTEQALNEENSVLNFKPRFVAVIETGLWNFQVVSFVEEKLGLFISEVYGGEAILETSDKHGGKYFVWSGPDGRKAFGLVIGSLVFFGNDESAIEKCLAVKNGEQKSIAGNPKVPTGSHLAFGYVPPDGVAQLSNLAGISLAKGASDESDIQSFIARTLPEILRNSATELVWTADAKDGFMEDVYSIALAPELATVFNETLRPSGKSVPDQFVSIFPTSFQSVTRYDLTEPQVAWRSVLLSAQKLTDQRGSAILAAFSSGLFDPYGIEVPEIFLGAVEPIMFTARLDDDAEKVVVVGTVKDETRLKSSIAKEFDLTKPAEKIGDAQTWLSNDADLRFILIGRTVIIGHPSTAFEILKQLGNPAIPLTDDTLSSNFRGSKATAATISNEESSLIKIARVLSGEAIPDNAERATSLTETSFDQGRVIRRVRSESGFIGSIIAQLANE